MFPILKLKKEFGLFDLMEADITLTSKNMIFEDTDSTIYGFLPYIATHSRASVGTLLASSYAERINSAANLILTKGNALLDDATIHMCTVLRINREVMAFLRFFFPKVAHQTSGMTLVPK
mmetsp:Transcript_19067/g.47859  ORF Transcript_19067/g.47859 Transcript_19067/m.47859 type:complete len:120 (+) Transcript_19067:2055-2414(+)